jgi:nicotinate-nucleotide adenylyltransferase
MRLAILGGTFNPVHVGHLFLAEEARALLGFDRILFVPANVPVHKTMPVEVGAGHRLAMLRLAVAGHRDFRVDACELERGGKSYMIDTLLDVLRRYRPESRPGLIIGDDLVEGFPAWKQAARVAELAELIVARRDTERPSAPAWPFPAAISYLENLLLPVSSSEVRRRLASGRSVRHLVPERVLRYIRRHRLYV